MMVSAAFAVTVAARRRRRPTAMLGYGLVTLVLVYALVENVLEKPDGIAISFGFIVGIIVVSLVSRVWRSTELRADRIEFDDQARAFIAEAIRRGGCTSSPTSARPATPVSTSSRSASSGP
jgi:hypothetical protein